MKPKITGQRSFLKYAGNKYRILPELFKYMPISKGRFIEPFVGSGVVFLNTCYDEYLLNDLNKDLINIFNQIKNNGLDFIRFCRDYFGEERNTPKSYNDLRDSFNNESLDDQTRAAIYLFLNRHNFNGLSRYNKAGKFNAPFGYYPNVAFPEQEMLAFFNKLQICEVKFTNTDYQVTLAQAKENDIVYCDPPYAPISESKNFREFVSKPFTKVDQEELATAARKTNHRVNAKVYVSNRDCDYTRELYNNADRIEIYCTGSTMRRGKSTKSNELLAIYEYNN